MVGSVNKAIIVGNLGRDLEVCYLVSGNLIVNVSVVTTDIW